MPTTGVVYCLAEPNTGLIRYCGKTTRCLNHRLNGHRRDAKRGLDRHVCRWLARIDRIGAWPPAVIVCEEIDLSGLDRVRQLALLNQAETRWIALLRTLGFQLTNATNGGDGTHGRVVSEESRRKMAVSNTGQKRSLETRERLRISHLGKVNQRGESHWAYGKPRVFKDPKGRAAKIKAAWDKPGMRGQASMTSLKQIGIPKRLTLEGVAEIFVADGSFRAVGKRFGVSHEWVARIKRGLAYAELTKELALGKYSRG